MDTQLDRVIEDKNVVGVPAKVVGEVSEDYRKLWTSYKNLYIDLALKYTKTLEIMKPKQMQSNNQ